MLFWIFNAAVFLAGILSGYAVAATIHNRYLARLLHKQREIDEQLRRLEQGLARAESEVNS